MDADDPFLQTPAAVHGRFQFRLGTLFVGITGIALGLAVGRLSHSWLDGTIAGASFWLALGLVQQACDLWGARGQLTACERSMRHGWRYAILWRLAITLLISAYWLIHSLDAAHVIDLSAYQDYPASETLFREASFCLALVIGLSSAPWAHWRRTRTSATSIVDTLGWIAGIIFAATALSTVAWIATLVCIAIHGIEVSQPYVFAGQVIHDMDPHAIRHNAYVLVFLSSAMIGVSLVQVWLVRRLVRAASHRLRASVILLVSLIGSGTYAVWVHLAGLHAVSPLLAENQVWQSWVCWLPAAVLLGLFATSTAFRFHYRRPDESRQPLIIWHGGPGAYLHESRMLMVVLSAVFAYELWNASYYWLFDYSFDWESSLGMFAFLESPAQEYLPFAVLCLSLRGIFARRRIADRDQRMAPVAICPREFVITCVFVAAITVGLVEAVAWSSFALWLL